MCVYIIVAAVDLFCFSSKTLLYFHVQNYQFRNEFVVCEKCFRCRRSADIKQHAKDEQKTTEYMFQGTQKNTIIAQIEDVGSNEKSSMSEII